MVTVAEAFQIVQSVVVKPPIEEVDIRLSVGRILAESVTADRDFPPFNRVAMDGIAIQAEHLAPGHLFVIEGVQAAGSAPTALKDQRNCVEVMTGSVLPANTNAVVRYEDIEIRDGKARILLEVVEAGLNIHPQGQDARLGDELIKPGQRISAAEVALLASVGKRTVCVFDFPKTAVISTGDELVEVDDAPQPHQIRKSNTYALQAAMKDMGWKSESFHLLDNREMVMKNLKTILENDDVLILSGGVSKGKFDFIPEALESLGIQKLFHQVSQRPGKPFWFGASADRTKIVFALPGNPVSTFLCFHKYIKPWVLNHVGIAPQPLSAKLESDVTFVPKLSYFLQVHARIQDGVLCASPRAGGGSGDFANLSEVDGFLELPLERSVFRAGEIFPYVPFRPLARSRFSNPADGLPLYDKLNYLCRLESNKIVVHVR